MHLALLPRFALAPQARQMVLHAVERDVYDCTPPGIALAPHARPVMERQREVYSKGLRSSSLRERIPATRAALALEQQLLQTRRVSPPEVRLLSRPLVQAEAALSRP